MGARHIIFKDNDKVRVFSDDGEENTDRLPQTIAEISKLKVKDAILDVEIEAWEGKKHLPREVVAGYLHSKRKPDDSSLMTNVFGLLYLNGEDLHQEPEEKRRELLEKIEFPQSTINEPDLNHRLNLVPSKIAKNVAELKKIVEDLRWRPASEGVVVKKHDAVYYLDRNSRNGWFKLHNTAILAGIVVEVIETKVKGVYNYRYAIDQEDYEVKPGDLAEVKDREWLEVGKTFSTERRVNRGDIIEIEFETLNFIRDERSGTIKVTAWVPRFMGVLPERAAPDKVDDIVERARKNKILREKAITPEGKTIYESFLRGVEVEYLNLDEYKQFLKEAYDISEARSTAYLGARAFLERVQDWRPGEEEIREAEREDPEFGKALRKAQAEARKLPRFWAVLQNHFRGKSVSDLTPIIVKRRAGRVEVIPICSLFPDRFKGREIEISDGMMVWGEKGWEKVKWIMRHESSDRLLRINTYDGAIDVTKDHSLFQDGQEVESEKLRVGDSIDEVELPMLEGTKEVDSEFAKMLGFWVAEGSYKRETGEANFAQIERTSLDRIAEWALRYGLKVSIYEDKLNGSYKMSMSGLRIFEQFYSRSPHEKVTRKARLKKIPSFVFEWNKKSKRAFFEGYLEGDGINIKNNHIEFATASQALAQGLILIAKVIYPQRIPTVDLQENIFRIKLIDPKNNATRKRARNEIKKILESKSRDSLGEANPNFKNGKFMRKELFAKQFWTYSHKRYVYDIETGSHCFQAGVGKILAHNSQHKDFRVKMNDYLRGWTITDQPEGKITKDVETVKDGRYWQEKIKWKFRPDMDPATHCVAIAKAKQPTIWMKWDDKGMGKYAAAPPGSVTATRFEWGVMVQEDAGYAYLTCKKPYFEEYFLDMKKYKGRMIVRLIPVGKKWKKPPKGKKLQWQTWNNLKDQTPYILSRRARLKKDYVPDGVNTTASGLPPWWEEKIPIAMRWWVGKLTRGEKLARMDQAYNYLVEKGELKGKPLKESPEPKLVDFIVRRHWWRGQIVVRGMPVQHWDLVIDAGRGYLDEFNLERDPLIKENLEAGIPAFRKKCKIGTPKGEPYEKWMEFEGSIPPNHPEWGNPNKKIPAYMKIVDKGKVNWIEDTSLFSSFEFKGKVLKGYVTIRREDPEADIWVMQRAALPGEKRKEAVAVMGG